MFAQERLDKIIELLYKDGKVVVKDLSIMFDISQDAIRKDLKVLENKGIIERTYGGAILKKQIPRFTKVEERTKENVRDKTIIAKKAFDLIKENETIFLDISSTNIILSQIIAESSLHITIISNCIDILYILSKSKNHNLQIICPEGIFYPNVGGFVGSATIKSIERYKSQKVFIGSCGVDLRGGSVNTFNIEDGNTKKAIIDIGKEVILVMENRKFFYEGTFKFADIEEIDTIVTEDKPITEVVRILEKQKINII